jgi:hypothetical protein
MRIPEVSAVLVMMRDVLCGLDRAAGLKTKDRPGHQVGHRFRERLGSRPFGLAHPGFRPFHRGRSRPGWRNRLFEGRLVPDAPGIMEIGAGPSRVFFGLGLGLLQLVGYQFEIIRANPYP